MVVASAPENMVAALKSIAAAVAFEGQGRGI
jgi:hypothetical protein